MANLDDLPCIEIASRKQWRTWLKSHHKQQGAIWLVIWKKPDPRYIPNADVVEEALCFGWIDSLPRKLDEERSMLLLAPRKSKSAWSAINKARAERLIAAGLMMPAGQKMIDLAKASGTWDKLNDVEALAIPPDLAKALTKAAAKNFDTFPRSVKRGILEWILQAKRTETRAARIRETAEKAKDNLRANQWRK
jgi:uncharacterized protein YdeI (YjbR/CyaY-like superfamily)